MSYERGMAAIRLQAPDEIPHTQYVTNPDWLSYLRAKAGQPEADIADLLDFDFLWTTDTPDPPGRWTQMGRVVWREDRQEYIPAEPSPFKDVEEIYNLDPFAEYGRLDHKTQVEKYQSWYNEMRQQDRVVPGGTYRSVISFAIAAFGWENLLLAAGLDAERFGAMLNRWADYLMQYVEAWAATDIEVYLTHDDMVWTAGGIFRPQFYRAYVFPNLKRYWDCIRDAGKKVLFCSDGNFDEYVGDLAAAGAEGFIFEPLTDLGRIVKKYGKTHVIIGNADCRVLAFGTKEDIYNEVKRCLDLGRDCPGYFFAVGNHIPHNISIENANACMGAYWELRRR